jgi:predicted DsbA family dithiol-disulfide isomerase
MPFRPPTHVPNSRRALAVAESVRLNQPQHFDALDRALFTAYFVDGLDIGDADVVAELVRSAGAQPVEPDDRVVDTSVRDAYDAGVSGTPSWFIDNRLVIPGVQDRSYYERMVARLRSTTSSSPSSP